MNQGTNKLYTVVLEHGRLVHLKPCYMLQVALKKSFYVTDFKVKQLGKGCCLTCGVSTIMPKILEILVERLQGDMLGNLWKIY